MVGAVRRIAGTRGRFRRSRGVAGLGLSVARVVARVLTRVTTIGLVRGAGPIRRSFSVCARGGSSGASRHFQFEFLS